MTTTEQIVRATAVDVEALAWLIADAFEPMTACQWLVPDPETRRSVLAAQFAILVEHAVRHGQIDTTWDRSAVAVWLPRADGPAAEPVDYERRLTTACGPYVSKFRHLDDLFSRNHPTVAHHHLALLAVEPDQQGRGLGTTLLAHHHRLLDEHATHAHLEASNLRNRALYLRHGYQDHGQPFALPNGARFWPMWRPGNSAPE